MSEMKIDISAKTLIKILVFGVLIYLLYLISHLLLLLFVSIILASLIEPFAAWLQKRKIPRELSVVLVYLFLFGLVALSFTLLMPIVVKDMPQFVSNMDKMWQDLQDNSNWQKIIGAINNIQQGLFSTPTINSTHSVVGSQTGIQNAISGVFSTITGFVGGMFSLVLILVMTFYIVTQEDTVKKIVSTFAPANKVVYFLELYDKVTKKLGSWVRAQFILSLLVGLMVFIALTAFKVKYASVLALLAGLLEIVPYIGPITAAVPALLFAFSQGGVVKLVIILIAYVIIHEIEANLLVPKIMQKAVGLNPIISIMAILVGSKLAGVIGVIIAIPVATALSVIIKDVLERKQSR